jgi:outer membrane scaffolding protein for murein synthesis (MipA/OmpV family)
MGLIPQRMAPMRLAACGLVLASAAAARAADGPTEQPAGLWAGLQKELQSEPPKDLWADLLANASLALGASAGVSSSTTAGGLSAQARPLWAFQYGRIRLSSGGGAAVLGFAQDPRGPGASAELFSGDKLRMGIALRIDRGRDSSAINGLEGMPDVPATLRARAYASYALTPRWTAAGSVSQDILGRGGGTVATADIGYRAPLTPRSEWYAGGGMTWTDARYMKSYYSVPPGSGSSSGQAAYTTGAGPMNARIGVGFTAALTSRWILLGGVGATRLLGYAADSPLTQRPVSAAVSLGLAYRWGAKYEGLTSVLLPEPAAEKPAP